MNHKNRKLTEQQERFLAVSLLCGIPMSTLTQDYGVSPATINRLIMNGRSKDWNNALVEFYRQVPYIGRQRNAMHLYLGMSGKEVENWEILADNGRIAQYAFEKIDSGIVVPRLREIANLTGIETLSKYATTPFDMLLRTIFGNIDKPTDYVKPIFDRHALENFSRENYNWDATKDSTLKDVATRIIKGSFSPSPYKESIVNDVLGTLQPRQRTVIEARLGLNDGRVKTLEETADLLQDSPSRERVRQIEAQAVRRLQHPENAWKLGKIYEFGLFTDDELKEIITIGPGYSEHQKKRRNFPTSEVELSVRTRKVLDIMGINNLSQLCKVTAVAELLSFRNFGETSLQELNEVLASRGISYRL